MGENNGNGNGKGEHWDEQTRNFYLANPPAQTRCHICNSAFRHEVDRMLVQGYPHNLIAEELIARDVDFFGRKLQTVRRNVDRHASNHLEVREKAKRRLLEKRAKEEGILIDDLEHAYIAGEAVLEAIVAKGWDQLQKDDRGIRMDTVVEAVKMLTDLKRSNYQLELERMTKQVWAISAALREAQRVFELPGNFYSWIGERATYLFDHPDAEEIGTRMRELPSE
jgi:hypothetical protein